MAKSKPILVAAHLLLGGTKDKNDQIVPARLEGGEELTPEMKKALGLDSDAVGAMIERGDLIQVDARIAARADDSSASLAAAIARAEKAEGTVKALTARIAELEKALKEAPPKPAA